MKLNQVIALEKGIKSKRHKEVSELYKIVQRSDLFDGFSKKYRPKAESDTDILPPEAKKVQFSVPEILTKLRAAVSDYFDIAATRDYANCSAVADVVVGSQTIIQGAPVTFLLMLEKELTDIKTLVAELPVLSDSESWTLDANQGLYKTAPVETHRSKKTSRPIVLYDATEHHPAQTQLIQEDILVGFWENVKVSGAIAKPDKEKFVSRLELLIDAVKIAREEANGIEAVKQLPAKHIFDFIFN